jgi:ADP-ribose pyrophosphatase YjhB (NUDIX family)
MASIGYGHYVVVVLRFGGSIASNIKFVLHREPRTCEIWFLVGSVFPNEEHVDAVVRELHEETCLVLTLNDFTVLSDAMVRVALPKGQRQLVYVFLRLYMFAS